MGYYTYSSCIPVWIKAWGVRIPRNSWQLSAVRLLGSAHDVWTNTKVFWTSIKVPPHFISATRSAGQRDNLCHRALRLLSQTTGRSCAKPPSQRLYRRGVPAPGWVRFTNWMSTWAINVLDSTHPLGAHSRTWTQTRCCPTPQSQTQRKRGLKLQMKKQTHKQKKKPKTNC